MRTTTKNKSIVGHPGFCDDDELVASALDVGRDVNLLGQLGDRDVEAILHAVQNLGVSLVRDEGDCETLGTETTSTSDLENRS